MEALTLNGKRYIKASKAAKDFGYATDYVGQLCRTGAVDAHLVGRTWYVNPDVLGAHRVEKKRNARAKAREYAKKSIEESKTLSINQNTKSFRNIPIRYKTDESELIPDVKKVNIVSEEQLAPVPKDTETETYTLLNKDKKIIMSGTIPVYDVEEETVLTDTTILKPHIVRHSGVTQINTVSKRVTPKEAFDDGGSTTLSEPSPKKASFSEKLTRAEVGGAEEVEVVVKETSANTQGTPDSLTKSTWYESNILFYGALLAIVLVPFSMFFERGIQYSNATTTEIIRLDSSDLKQYFNK